MSTSVATSMQNHDVDAPTDLVLQPPQLELLPPPHPPLLLVQELERALLVDQAVELSDQNISREFTSLLISPRDNIPGSAA